LGTVTIFLKVYASKRDEFLQTIEALLLDLKQEKGFKISSTYQDVNNPNVFHLVLEWQTNDHLEAYLKSEHFRILIGTLKVLCEESEIRYRMVSQQDKGALVHEL
jgi:quinol monooxygenase YgiN